jgi:superfamily I DNA/RNA helicase
MDMAVTVQPLTSEQVEQYLDASQGKLEGVKYLLQQDPLVDDSVLEIIKPARRNSTIFEEERRLFYIALTRSKKLAYIYTQKGRLCTVCEMALFPFRFFYQKRSHTS